MIVKNTYGTSVAFSTRMFGIVPKDEFTGSSIQRKKKESENEDKPKPKQKSKKKNAP